MSVSVFKIKRLLNRGGTRGNTGGAASAKFPTVSEVKEFLKDKAYRIG